MMKLKILNFADSLKTQKSKYFKKIYGSFLWVGFNCLKVAEPLQKGSSFITASLQEYSEVATRGVLP